MRARLLLVLVAALALSGTATAKSPTVVRHDAYPLHAGSHGPRVANLQWLLRPSPPKQNVFKQVRGTFKWEPNGYYGARTKHSVLAEEFRLGFPKGGQCGLPATRTMLQPTAGPLLLDLIRGRKTRPRCWVALAAERVKGVVREGATPTALAIKTLLLTQLGVHEIPDGSNRGPCISFTCTLNGHRYGPYQGSTGAFGQAWCASLIQWALKSVTGHIYPAPLPAFVPSLAETAHSSNQLAAKPRVGSLVVFLSADLRLVNAFHVGFVMKVTATGIQTFEGNYSNRAAEVWRPFASNHMLYVDAPGVA